MGSSRELFEILFVNPAMVAVVVGIVVAAYRTYRKIQVQEMQGQQPSFWNAFVEEYKKQSKRGRNKDEADDSVEESNVVASQSIVQENSSVVTGDSALPKSAPHIDFNPRSYTEFEEK